MNMNEKTGGLIVFLLVDVEIVISYWSFLYNEEGTDG